MTTTYSRNGLKWSVNETLSLQREFELLEWDIDTIAQKHKRTPNAIMYKLDGEGLADYNVLYSNYYELNSSMPVTRKTSTLNNLLSEDEDNESDYYYDEDEDEEYLDTGNDEDDEDVEEDEIANLSERVEGLEEGIFEIKNMIKELMNSFLNKNSNESVFSH